jgi:hypothetical protein
VTVNCIPVPIFMNMPNSFKCRNECFLRNHMRAASDVISPLFALKRNLYRNMRRKKENKFNTLQRKIKRTERDRDRSTE